MKTSDNRAAELEGIASSTVASTDLVTVTRTVTGNNFPSNFKATVQALFETYNLGGLTATDDEINRAADVSTRIVALAAAATNLTVTPASHEGKIVTLNSATGQAITLPAASGSGSRYEFIFTTSVASGNTVIAVANTSDAMTGYCLHAADGGDTAVMFETTAATDTITLNGTSTGGVKGNKVSISDIAANLFHVQVFGSATGTEATPFSAAV